MTKREIFPPVRIMRVSGNIDNAEALLTCSTTQSYVGESIKAPTRISGKGYIVLDFGKEIRGGIRIITGNSLNSGKNSVPLRVRFGESVNECMAEIGEKNAGCDHALRDIEARFVSFSSAKIGESGYRFVRLDFEDNTNAEIREILSDGEILDLPAIYTYQGNDPELKRIFETAKRTIDLCAAGDYVWDGIKRDRLVWIGDLHPEMLALVALYGRCDVFEHSMEFLKSTTPSDRWMCKIYTYSAWWIICLADWYLKTSCADFVLDKLEYAEKIIEKFLASVDENGEINIDARGLIDWPTVGKSDEADGIRALLQLMVHRAIYLFKDFSRDLSKSVTLLERLEKKPVKAREMMQVAGLKFMAQGRLDDDEVELLHSLGAKGMSTFMSYYILTAYAHYFGVDEAVRIMKEYYGGMLSVGATSFWEDFRLEWLDGSGRIDEFTPDGVKDVHGDHGAFCYVGFRHSLCHAWSSGIIAFMQENGL